MVCRTVLALILLLPAAGAHAEDLWTDPYPGVRHLSRTDRYPYDDRPRYRLEAVVVDLGHPAVSIVATPPDQAGGTVSAFAQRSGAVVAWNTNFFGSPQDSCGLMVGDGQVWPRAYDDGCHASIGFGALNQAAIFVQGDPHGPPPEAWMRQVASGKPEPILTDGEPRFRYGCGASCAYHPRTGIGLDRDRRTLYVVVVDGRQAGTVGAGLDDLANLMSDLGASDAVNLDGGGSSTLFVAADGGVVNRPSDGNERTVCCHLGVRVDPAAAWWRAELVDQADADVPLRPGDTLGLWARFRNTGRRPWRPDSDHPVRLGTESPRDRESAWAHPSWMGATRPAHVGAPVDPGEVGRFEFTARAPAVGRYEERFAPVAEGASWMDALVGWTLEVVAPPTPDATLPDATLPDATLPDAPLPDATLPDATGDAARVGPDAGPPDVNVSRGDATPGRSDLAGGCSTSPTPVVLWLLVAGIRRRRKC